MSFWKQEPPNPTLDLRNFAPILESRPQALDTSSTSAPVASQIAENALMDEIRWASNALAALGEMVDLPVLRVPKTTHLRR